MAVTEEKIGQYKNVLDSYAQFLNLVGDEAKKLIALANQRIKAIELAPRND